MSNRLTGAFDVVLEVSAETLNRLAASLHQNALSGTGAPALLHATRFRLGGNNEHGSISAQIGCPEVSLIHGATDRIAIAMAIRARFRRDPNSAQLADVIYGTARATYRVQDIDPDCQGWRSLADDYLWLRAIRSSVSFDGKAYDESPPFVPGAVADADAVKARITRLLQRLLTIAFDPVPQPVDRRFRRFRSLVRHRRPGGAALAIPLSPDGSPATGSLRSIDEIFLDGADFAIALNSELVVDAVRSTIADMVGFERSFYISGDAGFGGGLGINYHLRLDDFEVNWIPLGQPPFGLLRIVLNGHGWASRVYRSGVFNVGSLDIEDLNATVQVEQHLMLMFTAPDGWSLAMLGSPAINVGYGGPFENYIRPYARRVVAAEVQKLMALYLAAAQGRLAALSAGDAVTAMTETLKGIDPAADAVIDRASFHADAIVLHGTIDLSRRRPPHIEFSKLPSGDGFTAFDTWIPGGRIDAFTWSWEQYNAVSLLPANKGGNIKNTRIVELRRPHGGVTGFGKPLGVRAPLPGIDGYGRICLTIKGAHIDHVTGLWTQVESQTICQSFGLGIGWGIVPRPRISLYAPVAEGPPRPPRPREVDQVGLVMAAQTDAAPSMLLGYLGTNFDGEPAVLEALRGTEQLGRALLVVFIVGNATLRAATTLTSRLQQFMNECPARVAVIEDVAGDWAANLGIAHVPPETVWQLLAPNGAPQWVPDEPFTADHLAHTLRTTLGFGPAPHPASIPIGPTVGSPFVTQLIVPRCPPIPVRRTLGRRPGRILYVDNGSASARMVDWLALHAAERDNLIAAVLIDGGADQAKEIAAKLDDLVPVLADQDGATVSATGVDWLPSLIDLDPDGLVTAITTQVPTAPMTININTSVEQS